MPLKDSINIQYVLVRVAYIYTNRLGVEVYQIQLQEIMLDNSNPLQVYITSVEDFEAFIKGKKDIDPKDKLPSKYYNLTDAFSKKMADILLPRREGVDYAIYLKPNSLLPF